MAAMRGFMRHFFQCSDCSKHFASMAAEPEALTVSTPADALLWSWRAHNRVNVAHIHSVLAQFPSACLDMISSLVMHAHDPFPGSPTGCLQNNSVSSYGVAQVNVRVGAAERDGRSGDPAYPKKQWPTVEQCARCRATDGGAGVWNEVEVLRFLQDFYGVTQPRSSGTRKHLGSLDAGTTAVPRWVIWSGTSPSALLLFSIPAYASSLGCPMERCLLVLCGQWYYLSPLRRLWV